MLLFYRGRMMEFLAKSENVLIGKEVNLKDENGYYSRRCSVKYVY